jgi:hypothetical protein
MSNTASDQDPRDRDLLESMQRRLDKLSIAVTLMALAILLLAGAQYGSLVNYWSADVLFFGGTSLAAALAGFGFGWFAGRRF